MQLDLSWQFLQLEYSCEETCYDQLREGQNIVQHEYTAGL